jgi:hypothetical protein
MEKEIRHFIIRRSDTGSLADQPAYGELKEEGWSLRDVFVQRDGEGDVFYVTMERSLDGSGPARQSV